MNLLTKGARINRDVWTCLNTIATCREFLQPQNHGSLPLPEVSDATRDALEGTVRLACDRIDSLLITLTNQTGEDELEAMIKERGKQEIEHTKASTAAEHARKSLIDTSNRPSILYRPTLLQTAEGAWVAFYGDPSDVNTCVAAAGETPEGAMLAFDKEWVTKHPPKKQQQETPQPKKLKRGKK